MQRRSWLKLGLASAAVLAAGGGAVAWVEPGLRGGVLTPAGRRVFAAVARGMLDGSLPPPGAQQAQALDGLLSRIDALATGLPAHAQAELSQLLALLATGAGRRALAGLQPPWDAASTEQLQHAFQAMRTSAVSLRQQAYHALHDITTSAYFSAPSTWTLMGYPGPIAL